MNFKKSTFTSINNLFILSVFLMTSFHLSAQPTIKDVLNNSDAGRVDLSIPLRDEINSSVLPVTIINGVQKGPTFVVVAGIHGYEYPPILAVQRIMNKIDHNKLKGSLIFLPIANIPSFYGRSPFFNPLDKKNLNNVFPGKKDGTITEQIAYLITKEIISECDVFVDIHGGDANEDLLPFVCYYDRADSRNQTKLAAKLCKISGFENIVSYNYNITPSQPAIYAFKQATQDGKVALSIEAGKLGNVQNEAVDQIESAVFNMLYEMNMYQDEHKKNLQKVSTKTFNQQSYLKSTIQGILYSDLLSGDNVVQGEVVGSVTDVWGKKLQELTAPASGIILYKIGTPPVNEGETIFCIGYNKE